MRCHNAPAHFNIALIAMIQGRLDEAETELRARWPSGPTMLKRTTTWGGLLMRKGSLDEAVAQFREVLRVRPDGSDAHYNLGRALLADGATADAVDHFRRAIVARPDAPSMLDDLAWLLATSPITMIRQPKEAVTLAERAATLTGGKKARRSSTRSARRMRPLDNTIRPRRPPATRLTTRGRIGRPISNRRSCIGWRSTSNINPIATTRA